MADVPTVGMHNIDVVEKLATQMEVKTKKHDNLSESVNIVLQLEPICIGRGANHITVNCLLASIHMV